MKLLLIVSLVTFVSEAREWAAHDVSLRGQLDKIREKENKIEELVHEKDKEKKDEAKLKILFGELQKSHKELEKIYKEWEEEKKHVRFEHPDKGVEVERKYRNYKLRSIEDIESEIGTDGKLNRLKSKVLRKYGNPESEQKTMPVPEEEKPKPAAKPEATERPRLSF